ncbi:hypothetical protein EVAR_42007_1 [Eumeta japonica]|uniref:Uncharacterized protein n=1 Tax=Eumeta variegata TaxID=151549 RepID=A0A4C1WPT5_EUMVA|nr:hypothetical protein EVAR_42007_1 [Eumeta japonica]
MLGPQRAEEHGHNTYTRTRTHGTRGRAMDVHGITLPSMEISKRLDNFSYIFVFPALPLCHGRPRGRIGMMKGECEDRREWGYERKSEPLEFLLTGRNASVKPVTQNLNLLRMWGSLVDLIRWELDHLLKSKLNCANETSRRPLVKRRRPITSTPPFFTMSGLFGSQVRKEHFVGNRPSPALPHGYLSQEPSNVESPIRNKSAIDLQCSSLAPM